MKAGSLVARLLIAATTCAAVTPHAYASTLATDAASGERERILVLLERTDVRQQLEAHGVKPSDAKARVAALTDPEVAGLAASMDTAAAGGNAGAAIAVVVYAVVGIVVIALVSVALVAKGVEFAVKKAVSESGKEVVPAAADGTP